MEPNREESEPAAWDRLVAALAARSGEVELDEFSLLVAGVLQPDLDVVEWLSVLDELAARCPAPTREAVVRFLADEGYTGPVDRFHDWRHSCLDRTLQTRQGLPITLSIIVIEVARRLGLELVGVGLPAHFIIGDRGDPGWYSDPFDAGATLDTDGVRALFQRSTGGTLAWAPEYLAPVGTRSILLRMLNNLKAACSHQHDAVRLALVMRMRQLFVEFAAEQDEAARAQAVLN